jgi:hypothetical protein
VGRFARRASAAVDLSCGDRLPRVEPVVSFFTVEHGGQEMSFGPEVSSQDSIHFTEPLCLFGRFEALHAPLPLAGRLVRILRVIVQMPALPMSDSRKNSFLSLWSPKFCPRVTG